MNSKDKSTRSKGKAQGKQGNTKEQAREKQRASKQKSKTIQCKHKERAQYKTIFANKKRTKKTGMLPTRYGPFRNGFNK